MRTSISHRFAIVKKLRRTCAAHLMTVVAAGLLGTSVCAAQSPPAQPAAAAPHKVAHPSAHTARAHVSKAHPSSKQPEVAAAPAAPPAPAKPDWPINNQPVPASVTWDSHGLRIDAKNSSLKQILDDVATATGTRIQGMGADQRVFGDYGPGTARDVLSQLLNGSGYNILMIGDEGQGVPRQVELTARHTSITPAAGPAPPPGNSDEDSADNGDVDDSQPQAPQTPPNIRPGFGPGVPMRTPQQIMQEMQERQRQMQQPTNPPN